MYEQNERELGKVARKGEFSILNSLVAKLGELNVEGRAVKRDIAKVRIGERSGVRASCGKLLVTDKRVFKQRERLISDSAG